VFVVLQGIPTLVLLDENDEIITSDGRSVISKDQEGKVSNIAAVAHILMQ